MADEQSVDTSVDSDDTSNEDDDVSLEDIEVDEADISDDDDEQETDDESDEATDDESSEEEAEADDTEEVETAQSDEDQRKQEAREQYDRRQAEKQARIDKVKSDQTQYLTEAADDPDPLVLAVRQIQVNDYNNRVEATTNKLTNGYEKALNDFPVLQTKDPVIQQEIDAAIDAFQAMNVTIDAYGNPSEVRGDLYATLQAKADSIERLTGIRVKQQEKSKSKEKSKTLAPPTRAPREPKKDPDMEAFDEEAGW